MRDLSFICRRLFTPTASRLGLTRRDFHSSEFLQKIVPINLKNRSKSSQEWLTRQLNDPFVKKARYANYRTRSAFKLLEVNEKHKILLPGMTVLDCGAAPGSWCQVAVDAVNSNDKDVSKKVGFVIGVDLLHISPLKGAILLGEMDFTHSATQEAVAKHLDGKRIDVILSDMAPNATGVRELDHDKIISLGYSAVTFALRFLRDGGTALVKIWDGEKAESFFANLEKVFGRVHRVRPEATRSESSEMYLLARDFKKNIKK